MDEFDWRSFLEEFGGELLEEDDVRYGLPDEVVASGWLGFDGASEPDLQALEHRLGVRLPPSYRTFLATCNGWRTTGPEMIQLWPTEGVSRLRDIDPQIIAIWSNDTGLHRIPDEECFVYGDKQVCTNIRREHIADMLAVSSRDWANQDYPWLNPNVVFDDGEWEVWHFSVEYPGAPRFRSFRELMHDELKYMRWSR
jgi:hypothetical protein